MKPVELTGRGLERSVRALSRRDPDLASVVARHGAPPMWSRPAGFATLLRIILEQQVSLASAHAVYRRLQRRIGRVTAHRVSDLSEADLRRCGFTRQKASYCRALARLVAGRDLDLRRLRSCDDEEVRRRLTQVRGIGPWTADVFLLMALRRPDVWPGGDLALAESMRVVKRLRTRPDGARMLRVAETWRPWRSVAARILWHDYLAAARHRRRHPSTKRMSR